MTKYVRRCGRGEPTTPRNLDRVPAVVHVIDSLGTGGSERSLAELLPGLAAAGLQPVVVCVRPSADGVERTVFDSGFDVRMLPQRPFLVQLRALRRHLKEVRPALVHTTLFRANVLGRLAAVGLRVPVITSLVGMPNPPGPSATTVKNRIARRGVRAVDRFSARHFTTHFHAVSTAVADGFAERFDLPLARITVVPRGRDRSRLGEPSAARRRAVRATQGWAPNAEVVVAVARHEFVKGLGNLVEAAALLAPNRPHLVVAIAGREGQTTAELRALGGDVDLLGHRDDVADLLAAADLLVCPSLAEGHPGSIIEAMALGIAVVASDLPSIREVVGDDAAVLVSPTSSCKLAAAIARVLDDDDLRSRLGAAGSVRFEERYTLEACHRSMVELFTGVIAKGVSRG